MQFSSSFLFVIALITLPKPGTSLKLERNKPRLEVYDNQCPHPFTPVEGGWCYFFSFAAERHTWDNAQLFCGWLHPEGHLAELETFDEIIDITIFLTSSSHAGSHGWTPSPGPWIGGIEIRDTNEFIWTKANLSILQTNWAPSQPDSPTSGDAIALNASSTFEWEDLPRDTELPFICEVQSNAPPVTLVCPEGFFRLETGCYAINAEQSLNWNDCQSYCASLTAGGRLAEFETEKENYLLVDYLADNGPCVYYWFGATEKGATGAYKWATSGLPLTFSNWGDGEPNDGAAESGVAMACGARQCKKGAGLIM
ncbi:unnamed protein product [Cyprideis torosa]|uniref:Uncharacterized protein n=1 Tax=Cyprideis torosa TaxID=163714 RepID=A0A7R8WHF0_9CRUS|nr:unnamed protein product [Cyprideis torosa]CAG0899319.1 unnamed protein product [Cyprideis torosa]